VFVLDSADGTDTVTDFRAGTDRIQVQQDALYVGNGNATVDAGELVVVADRVAGSIDAAAAAAVIGTGGNAYAEGATALFVVHDGKDSAVFLFTSQDGDAAVSAGELVEVAVLVGAPGVTAADIAFAF